MLFVQEGARKKKDDCGDQMTTCDASLSLSASSFRQTTSRPEENRTGSNSVLLTEAAEKKTALLFVNQTSALAGRGILYTQPLKRYMPY